MDSEDEPAQAQTGGLLRGTGIALGIVGSLAFLWAWAASDSVMQGMAVGGTEALVPLPLLAERMDVATAWWTIGGAAAVGLLLSTVSVVLFLRAAAASPDAEG